MHRIHGMTHEAIAVQLRVSERTVRNDIAQAMLCFLLDTDLEPDGLCRGTAGSR
ncbi:sigma factor-like helix-turn-helix DNA-binding protein [Achromobacter mucicolens]|nr:sigma-70 region 4 domain-containing protein [Achromobacter mucicolens]WBX91759.1 sigma-70 region 4 domain-containing protein [Achromobacter mucicolens]